MVTVQSVMTDPIFEGFQIVAGRRGLYNQVSGTAIFDWEEPQDVAETFSRGEFVITTLSEAKYRPEALLKRIKALLEVHVSAICIKTLFFKSVPKEIIRMADEQRVPIFLFEDTYVDDIIFAIRNALQDNDSIDYLAEQVEELLWDEDIPMEISAKVIRHLSPFLYENFKCVYLSPRYQKDRRTGNLIGEEYQKVTEYFQDWHIDSDREFFVAVKLRGSIVIICSMKQIRADVDVDQLIDRILADLSLCKRFFVGIRNCHHKHNEFAIALKESMYAGISASIDREASLKYSELGVDSMLIPICNHSWIQTSYEARIGQLKEYDRKHNTKLFDTLLTYAESEGSVSLTAAKLLQHENTIRHRLERIRKILGTDEQDDTYVHMYLLARLYKILQVMNN